MAQIIDLARTGDLDGVIDLLNKGTDVTRYGYKFVYTYE